MATAIDCTTYAMEQLTAAYRPAGARFRPEDPPFGTVFADIPTRPPCTPEQGHVQLALRLG